MMKYMKKEYPINKKRIPTKKSLFISISPIKFINTINKIDGINQFKFVFMIN